MKIIAVINWVLIGLYGIAVIYTLLNVSRSGNDAAGRGMEMGFVFIGVFLLAALAGLNVLAYRSAKIVALLVLGLPALIGLYNGISNYMEHRKQERLEQQRNSDPGADAEDDTLAKP